MRSRAEETKEHDLAYTGFVRGPDHISSPLHVDSPECLCANFAVDSGTVDDRITTFECFSQIGGLVHTARDEATTRQRANCRIATVHSPSEQNELAPPGRQGAGDGAADEAGAA